MVVHPKNNHKSITNHLPCLHGGTTGANQMSHLWGAPWQPVHFRLENPKCSWTFHRKMCVKIWNRIVVNLPEGRSCQIETQDVEFLTNLSGCPRKSLKVATFQKGNLEKEKLRLPTMSPGTITSFSFGSSGGCLKWCGQTSLRHPYWGLGPKLTF